jgi:hypothetical protein
MKAPQTEVALVSLTPMRVDTRRFGSPVGDDAQARIRGGGTAAQVLGHLETAEADRVQSIRLDREHTLFSERLVSEPTRNRPGSLLRRAPPCGQSAPLQNSIQSTNVIVVFLIIGSCGRSALGQGRL